MSSSFLVYEWIEDEVSMLFRHGITRLSRSLYLPSWRNGEEEQPQEEQEEEEKEEEEDLHLCYEVVSSSHKRDMI